MMGKTLYITDPVVAAAYFIHPAEFVWVADNAEALWLLGRHHAYTLEHRGALPPAYYVHPDAPAFVPFPDLSPPDTQPATMTVSVKQIAPGVFDVTFAGTPDTVAATGYFLGVNAASAVVGQVTWPQAPGTTPDQAAGLLQAALVPQAAVIATQKFGATLEVRGAGATVLQAVSAALRVPKVAAPAPAPPAPPPAPGVTLRVGAEDTHTKIDIDGDGTTDVHVVVDRPPQNPR